MYPSQLVSKWGHIVVWSRCSYGCAVIIIKWTIRVPCVTKQPPTVISSFADAKFHRVYTRTQRAWVQMNRWYGPLAGHFPYFICLLIANVLRYDGDFTLSRVWTKIWRGFVIFVRFIWIHTWLLRFSRSTATLHYHNHCDGHFLSNGRLSQLIETRFGRNYCYAMLFNFQLLGISALVREAGK